jgi:hypothetical protein
MSAKLTYKERNALAVGTHPALAPVPPIVLTPVNTSFVQLEASALGVYGTSKDGFDAMMAPLVAALPAHAAQLKAMDEVLVKTAFTPGAISRANYDPVGAKIASVGAAGDALLRDFNYALAGQTPPPSGSPAPGPTKPAPTQPGHPVTPPPHEAPYPAPSPRGPITSQPADIEHPVLHALRASIPLVSVPPPRMARKVVGK